MIHMGSAFLQESWHILFSMGGEGIKILDFQIIHSLIFLFPKQSWKVYSIG